MRDREDGIYAETALYGTLLQHQGLGRNAPGQRLRQADPLRPHGRELGGLRAPDGRLPLRGEDLPEWIDEYGAALCGTEVQGEFPLLIKLIDAREWLSVQVHPDDAYAQHVEGDPYGKTEAWVVLDCDPGAQLIFGIDCDVETLRREIPEGRLEQHLKKVDVQVGDVLYIPAGTVHAIGANMLIYEVQQSSDRTYRLYAWGRNAELHIEKSLDVIEPQAGRQAPSRASRSRSRAACARC